MIYFRPGLSKGQTGIFKSLLIRLQILKYFQEHILMVI